MTFQINGITNTSALQFFQVFRFGILFAISILLAKSHLSQGEIGIYESFLFIFTALTFFWTNSIVQSLLAGPYDAKAKNAGKNPVIFNAFVSLFVMSLFSAVAVKIVSQYMEGMMSVQMLPGLTDSLFWYILIGNPAFLIEYIYLLNNKPRHIIIYGLISYSLQLAAVVLPLYAGYPLTWSFTGLIIVSGARLLFLFALINKYSAFIFDFLIIRKLLSAAFPLILYFVITGSEEYINFLIIRVTCDDSTFALYRYGARELPLSLLLASALSNSLVPEFAKPGNMENALAMLKKQSKRLMHIIFPLSIILLLSSEYLYPVVFNPDFSKSSAIFNIFLLLVAGRVLFPQTILLGLKRNKVILATGIAELIINVSLSLWLIRDYGITGVAWGLLCASVCEKILLAVYCRYRLNIPVGKYLPAGYYSIYMAILLVLYFV